MIERWIVVEPREKVRGCAVILPGRGVSARMMENFSEYMNLDGFVIVCLEPRDYEWYPQPNGADDQDEAVAGLKVATAELGKRIVSVQRAFKVRRKRTALMGFSAGAVMALQMLAETENPYAAVVSLAGAILVPQDLPTAKTKTPVLLRHAVDDECFSWMERYLPMKDALVGKGYQVYVSEKAYGGHGVCGADAEICGKFITGQPVFNRP